MIAKLLAQIDIDPGDLEVPQPGDPTQSTVTEVLEIIIGVAGAIALLVIVIAGIQFIMSQGDPQKSNNARNAIIYAGVGLVLAIFAFSVVRFVVSRVG